MAQTTSPRHGSTPPKGRPTPSRNRHRRDGRLFGATFQWIAIVLALLIAFIVAFLLLDGGDFNPFNDDASQGTTMSADESAVATVA